MSIFWNIHRWCILDKTENKMLLYTKTINFINLYIKGGNHTLNVYKVGPSSSFEYCQRK